MKQHTQAVMRLLKQIQLEILTNIKVSESELLTIQFPWKQLDLTINSAYADQFHEESADYATSMCITEDVQLRIEYLHKPPKLQPLTSFYNGITDILETIIKDVSIHALNKACILYLANPQPELLITTPYKLIKPKTTLPDGYVQRFISQLNLIIDAANKFWSEPISSFTTQQTKQLGIDPAVYKIYGLHSWFVLAGKDSYHLGRFKKSGFLAEAKPVWEVQYSVEGDETDFLHLIPIWLSYASVSMRDILLEDILNTPNWYNSELAELKANHNQRYFTNLWSIKWTN